jgi:NTE family protein
LIQRAIDRLPPALRIDPDVARLAQEGCRKVMNIVHLIYVPKDSETHAKDYEFSTASLQRHWSAGYEDARASIARRDFLARPTAEHPVVTHDVHREEDRG